MADTLADQIEALTRERDEARAERDEALSREALANGALEVLEPKAHRALAAERRLAEVRRAATEVAREFAIAESLYEARGLTLTACDIDANTLRALRDVLAEG